MIGAVDIGGTKIAVGMVDDAGKVLARTQAPTDRIATTTACDSSPACCAKRRSKAGAELSGIGIGSTGPVDPIRGEFGDVDFLPGWRGKNLVNDLAQIFNVTSRSKMMATPLPWPKPDGAPAGIARA